MKDSANILLLDRFMRGETSTEEEKQLLIWFRSDEARAEILNYYKNRWEETLHDQNQIESNRQERMYQNIKARMHELEVSEKPVTTHLSLHSWMKYAAAIIFIIGIGLGMFIHIPMNKVIAKEYRVEAEKGQRASLVLPDGTKVLLNSHSSLSYKSDYGTKERLVSLVGEAYFEVAKDKQHRFVVNASGMEVEALGTVFNVKAYKEDVNITTSLFNGKVKVSSANKFVILTEGQQAMLNKKDGELTASKPENIEYANMWRNNELAFNGETLEEIAVTLNRIYNVNIQFGSEKIKRYRFSGVIKNNSLDNVIQIITLTAPIEYSSIGNKITLNEKQ